MQIINLNLWQGVPVIPRNLGSNVILQPRDEAYSR